MALSSWLLIPGVIQLLNSGRLGNEADNIRWAINEAKYILSDIIKFYSPEATGYIGTGVGDILCDACNYVGVLSTILVFGVLFIKNIEKKNRIVMICVIGLITIFSLFDWTKLFLNAMQSYHVKTCSLWVILGLLLIALVVFDHIDEISRWQRIVMCSGSMLLFSVSIFIINSLGIKTNNEIYISAILIVGYTVIILLGGQQIYLCVIILSVLEIMSISHFTYKIDLTPEDNLVEYEKLAKINKIIDDEKIDFCRVANTDNLDANDIGNLLAKNSGMLIGYNGVSEYDSLISRYLYDFSDKFSLGKGYIYTNIDGRKGLRDILSTKYILAADDSLESEVLTLEGQLGDKHYYYKNNNCMPFGFTYRNYWGEDKKVFDGKYSLYDSMLSSVAVYDGAGIEKLNKVDYKTEEISLMDSDVLLNDLKIVNREEHIYQVNDIDPFIVYSLPSIVESDIGIRIKIKADYSQKAEIFVGDELGNVVTPSVGFDVMPGKHDYYVYLSPDKKISSIRLDIGRQDEKIEICEIEYIYISPNIIENPDYDYMNIVNFRNNYIEGNIDAEQEELLFFSIPYDSGWHLILNDIPTELEKVNVGLCGVMIDKGINKIVLYYVTPGIKIGGVISFIALSILILMYTIKIKKIREYISNKDSKRKICINEKGIKDE